MWRDVARFPEIRNYINKGVINKNKSRSQRRRPARASHRLGPPSFSANIIVPIHLRFVSGTANTVSVTNYTLGAACGVSAATTTSAYSLFQAIRLSKVEAWSPTGTSTTAATCSLLWVATSGNNFAPNAEISDTSINVSEPAHIVCRPPSKSLASDWVQCSTVLCTLFNFTGPVGTIVDVHCVGILNDSTTVPTSITAVGATVGLVYYQPMDGDGGSYTPLGKTVLP